MDEKAFYKFLKRNGKKGHFAEGLVEQAKQFEAYLAKKG